MKCIPCPLLRCADKLYSPSFMQRRWWNVFPVLCLDTHMKCIPRSSFWDHDSLERWKAKKYSLLFDSLEIDFPLGFHFYQGRIYFPRFNSARIISFQSSRLRLTWSCNKSIKTRMHSSRMHTARSLTMVCVCVWWKKCKKNAKKCKKLQKKIEKNEKKIEKKCKKKKCKKNFLRVSTRPLRSRHPLANTPPWEQTTPLWTDTHL